MDKFPVQYARILLRLMEDTAEKDRDAALKAYVAYLSDEQALGKAAYIIKEYERLAGEASGTLPLRVTAAHELTPAAKKVIEERFGGKIEDLTVDPSLVGGVIVRKGNTILNASISAQLDTLANSMK